MGMVTPEGVCQSMEIHPEASSTITTKRIHRIPIIEKVAKRLN